MSQPLVHVGLDESGALTATTPLFTMAAVVTLHPETLRRLVSRASSDRHLKHRRTATGEFKWSCASQQMHSAVLSQLAQAARRDVPPDSGQNQRGVGRAVAAGQRAVDAQDKIKTGDQTDALRKIGESG